MIHPKPKWLEREPPAQWAAEGLASLFFALSVLAAQLSGVGLLIFPELGALSSDVLIRPSGKWAKEPWKLVITPTLAAVIGVALRAHLPYSLGTILLAMSLCVGLVLGLRSNVAPAISAGVLPIVLGVDSWQYPLCIFGLLATLALTLFIWKQTRYGKQLTPQISPENTTVQILESRPKGNLWFVALFLFVTLLGTAAQLSGWKFILFPPLIVMAYEMLGHPKTCPWAKQPLTFPVVCTWAAATGVLGVRELGVSPVTSLVTLICTYAALKLARLRMPPALAIGLIPFILKSPDWRYVVSVGIGTCCLTLWYLLYQRLAQPLDNRAHPEPTIQSADSSEVAFR